MIVEIRAGEGGDDAKHLVLEQFSIYLAVAKRRGFTLETIEEAAGLLSFQVQAPHDRAFLHEAGGHRWQRVPPNARHDRVHTSTVTVAVLPEPTEAQLHIDQNDLEWTATRGSGAGGQARNKTSNAIQLRHKPSGVVVRCESERSQHRNRVSALAALRAKLWDAAVQKASTARSAARRAQVGSGMRGDKRRTIRMQDGVVKDHVLGVRWWLRDYLRGDWTTEDE